jgi:MSHA biogenesis protein MshN
VSLINKMLQDLESRKNPQVEAASKKSVCEDLKPVPSSARASSRRLPVVFLAIVIVGAGAYGWMQWGNLLFPRNTAAITSSPPVVARALPPKPVPAPIPAAVPAPATPAPMPVADTHPAPAAVVPVQNKNNMNEMPAASTPAKISAEAAKPAGTVAAPVANEKASVPVVKSAAADAGFWVVSRGDTLYGISGKTGVDLQSLSKWNHLGREHVIYPGQRLRLTAPAMGETKSAVTAPVEKKRNETRQEKVTVASVEKPRAKEAGTNSVPSSETAPAGTGVMDKKLRPPSSDERAEDEYHQAANMLQKGRAGDAERHLKSALDINAGHTKARELLAGLQLQNGHWREAEQTLEQGIAKVPAYYPFAQLLARVYVEHGANQKALDVMEGSRQAGAGDAEFMALLAALYQRAGDHAEAIKAYTEAIKLDPQEGRSWLGMGISLEAIQNANAASAAYQRALETGKLDENLLNYARQRLAVLKK